MSQLLQKKGNVFSELASFGYITLGIWGTIIILSLKYIVYSLINTYGYIQGLAVSTVSPKTKYFVMFSCFISIVIQMLPYITYYGFNILPYYCLVICNFIVSSLFLFLSFVFYGWFLFFLLRNCETDVFTPFSSHAVQKKKTKHKQNIHTHTHTQFYLYIRLIHFRF